MKIWVLTRRKQKILQDMTTEFNVPPLWTESAIEEMLTPVCQVLDISRPVIMQKHCEEMERIGRVVFRPADFMDNVAFDRMEVELIDEKKRERLDNRDRRFDDM